MFYFKMSYWSFIDAQRVWCHPGKELSIMTPSENKQITSEYIQTPQQQQKVKLECREETRVMNGLKYGPVCGALAVEASLLLSGQDVPDDDGLWVLLGVH